MENFIVTRFHERAKTVNNLFGIATKYKHHNLVNMVYNDYREINDYRAKNTVFAVSPLSPSWPNSRNYCFQYWAVFKRLTTCQRVDAISNCWVGLSLIKRYWLYWVPREKAVGTKHGTKAKYEITLVGVFVRCSTCSWSTWSIPQSQLTFVFCTQEMLSHGKVWKLVAR
jgi:hypothetical protein